jgi:molybdopterin biosynthesis enzyme
MRDEITVLPVRDTKQENESMSGVALAVQQIQNNYEVRHGHNISTMPQRNAQCVSIHTGATIQKPCSSMAILEQLKQTLQRFVHDCHSV